MSAFSLDDLKTTLPLNAHRVDVPEFGAGKVAYVAELAMNEREERIEAWWNAYKKETAKQDDIGQNAWILAACLCDESRNLLCDSPTSLSQTAIKFGVLGTVAARLLLKAMEVNSISATAAKELEKN